MYRFYASISLNRAPVAGFAADFTLDSGPGVSKVHSPDGRWAFAMQTTEPWPWSVASDEGRRLMKETLVEGTATLSQICGRTVEYRECADAVLRQMRHIA